MIRALVLGIFVALLNFILDASIIRSGRFPHTYAMNEIIIGAAVGFLAYVWMARQDAKKELEQSTQRVMEETVRKERKRIALDLHDTVCQAQTAAIMELESAGDLAHENPAAREHLSRALHLVRESMTEMRCALWNLFPEELQKVHLKSAMENMVKDLTAGNGLNAHVSFQGTMRTLPPDLEKGLLRIGQEALSNVVKHAQAREVQIDLFFDSHRASLSVKDNGQGFQPELWPGSFGLISMRDRTEALGGVWRIHSELGRGTEVQASIPIPPPVN